MSIILSVVNEHAPRMTIDPSCNVQAEFCSHNMATNQRFSSTLTYIASVSSIEWTCWICSLCFPQ